MTLITRKDFEKIYSYMRAIIDYRRKHFPDKKHEIRTVFFGIPSGDKPTVLFGGWQGEEFWDDKEKAWEMIQSEPVIGISATLLPNEIVIESDVDIDLKTEEGKAFLVRFTESLSEFLYKTLGLKHYPVYSGRRSVHFHIYLDSTNLDEIRAMKQALMQFIKENGLTTMMGIDIMGLHSTHPFRVIYSYNPKVFNDGLGIVVEEEVRDIEDPMIREIILESLKAKGKVLPIVTKTTLPFLDEWYNDDLPNIEKLLSKPKLNWQKYLHPQLPKLKTERKIPLALEGVTRRKWNGNGKSYAKLRGELYARLIGLPIEDGRNRVMLALLSLAIYNRKNPEKVAIDIEQWVEFVNWKEKSTARKFVEYYKQLYELLQKHNWDFSLVHKKLEEARETNEISNAGALLMLLHWKRRIRDLLETDYDDLRTEKMIKDSLKGFTEKLFSNKIGQ